MSKEALEPQHIPSLYVCFPLPTVTDQVIKIGKLKQSLVNFYAIHDCKITPSLLCTRGE